MQIENSTSGNDIMGSIDPNIFRFMNQDLPQGCNELKHSCESLGSVAAYCEDVYVKAQNKRQALEETKNYTTQSLASVAYQINVLATNFINLMDCQFAQLEKMESSINHLSDTIAIHKEKVSRREIGVLTANKTNRPFGRGTGIIPPQSPERPVQYNRRKVDYSLLDRIGHGVKEQQKDETLLVRHTSSIGGGSEQPGMAPMVGGGGEMMMAPSPQKPVSQTGSVRGMGTLTRRAESGSQYRPGKAVAPPSVPSEYQSRQFVIGGQQPQQPHFMDPTSGGQMIGGMGMGMGGMPTPPIGIAQRMSRGSIQNDFNRASMGDLPPPPLPSQLSSDQTSGAGGDHEDLPLPPTTPLYQSTQPQQAPSDFPDAEQVSPPLPPPPPSAYGIPTNVPPSGMLGQQQHQQYHPQQPQAYDAHQLPNSYYGSTAPQAQPEQIDEDLPPWVPPNYVEKVIAVYDYTKEKEDELSIQEDMIIYVLRKNDDGWYEGVTAPGLRGLFPGKCVK